MSNEEHLELTHENRRTGERARLMIDKADKSVYDKQKERLYLGRDDHWYIERGKKFAAILKGPRPGPKMLLICRNGDRSDLRKENWKYGTREEMAVGGYRYDASRDRWYASIGGGKLRKQKWFKTEASAIKWLDRQRDKRRGISPPVMRADQFEQNIKGCIGKVTKARPSGEEFIVWVQNLTTKKFAKSASKKGWWGTGAKVWSARADKTITEDDMRNETTGLEGMIFQYDVDRRGEIRNVRLCKDQQLGQPKRGEGATIEQILLQEDDDKPSIISL
ncbi:hypothetical protein KQI84_12820 [bacterium]|nr:hypothetical protein [bacterium]